MRRAAAIFGGEQYAWQSTTTASKSQIYFVGKLLWAKGLDIMLELEDYYKQCTGNYFTIDIYGSGPEQGAIKRAFHGRRQLQERAGDLEDDTRGPSTRSKKLKKWRKPTLQILETTLALFGGTKGIVAGGAGSNLSSTLSPGTAQTASVKNGPPADNNQEKFLKRLAKIKETLDAVELPQTFAELRRQPIPATFPGRVDHAELKEYKIFVNPSISEVLCTTTAEALAMGKFAIIPVHPSNSFFMKFPNCLAYRNKFEFVANLRWAMNHDPEPLTPELARHFTWEAATDRFIEASAITVREALERERMGHSKLDERIAWFHNELGKGATGDMLRKICGAGPVSHQVKYLKEKGFLSEATTTTINAVATTIKGVTTEPDDDDSSEDEDDGLSAKFRRSSFAEALRATVRDLSSFMQ